MKKPVNIFWFRRDLRLADNTGLFHALQSDLPVLLLFIFDRNILDLLENKNDARVEFIYGAVEHMQKELVAFKSSVDVYYGRPAEIFSRLVEKYAIGNVYTNEDYEPYARERDNEIAGLLKNNGAGFHGFKDQVIFSGNEIMKNDGSPYSIFTPYSEKWKTRLNESPGLHLKNFPSERLMNQCLQHVMKPMPTLSSMGFSTSGMSFPLLVTDADLISKYSKLRDFPGLDATSHLGIHLRFGTISIRRLAAEAMRLSTVFLKELIWRDFYHMILWHFPKLGRGHAFKPAYEHISWRNNEREFEGWCEGKTGYPLVDAGMRQLNETGFMHNRVRMVTASFLSKHLLIDWRWGESYFAGKLIDFDLASNNGGWQWAAGCGCDAAPYFRIFNPSLQQKKFDPDGSYIKRWLPDLQELSYPSPIVEHGYARMRAIEAYRKALNQE
jgi:deoxyribodipyrimidine photo-lyase